MKKFYSNNIQVFNYDSNGVQINPKLIVLKEKLIYELIKKYIKL